MVKKVLKKGEAQPVQTRLGEDIQKLESLVAQIEGGELSLDESLALFEEGVGLAKNIKKELKTVEQKIEELSTDLGEDL